MSVRAQQRSRVRVFMTPWTAARQAPLSVGFPRQEHWSGLPCSPPGVLPDPGTEPCRVYWQADSLLPVPPGKPERLLGDSKCWRKSFDGTGFREEGWLASSEGTEEMASSHVRKAKLDESIWKGALGDIISENLHILCVRREG